jgi:WS/DGAT/MGAT family acyltransferase
MTQLTTVDATFLNVEGGRTVAHIGGLGILDTSACPGGRLGLADMVELVRERAHLAKPLRQRLVEVPLGIDRPYWTDDPDFDPAGHVQEIELPPPGNDRQLADAIAGLHERPLDRRRPLWEMCMIHGLAEGRSALYAKIHHAAIDGVLAAETLAALLDLSPEPRALPACTDAPVEAPGTLRMLGAGLVKNLTHPFRSAQSLVRLAPYLDEIPGLGSAPGMGRASRALQTLMRRDTRNLPDMPRLSAPATPFNGAISGRHVFAYGSLPLEDVKQVRRALGGSINDVVMALCATALRRWLEDHGALPDEPLIAAVPVSLRQGGSCQGSNQLSLMVTPLATHVADPAERFEAVRTAMRAVKRRFVASSGSWVQEVSGMIPAPIAGLATRTVLQLAPNSLLRAVNLIVSNVPGPQLPLYLRGARVLAYYPVSVISDVSGGLNITVFSYDGHIDVGLTACPEMVPDVWNLMVYLADALDELKKLAEV